jgi:hypothetical protein
MPGLPAFCRTRFNAARRFWRSHALSIRSLLLPRRSFPLPVRGASTRALELCGFTARTVRAFGPSSDFCGITPPRRAGVSPFPSFGPSRFTATMASADFSLRWSCNPRRPFRREARSPRVRTSAFAARPPDLRRLALVTTALRPLARSPCSAPPHIRFLFVSPQLRSPLPSRQPRGPTLCGSLRSL